MNMTYVWVALAILSWIYKIYKKSKKEESKRVRPNTNSNTPKSKYTSPKLSIEELLKEIDTNSKIKQPAKVETKIEEETFTESKSLDLSKMTHHHENEEEFERFEEFEIDNEQNNSLLSIKDKFNNPSSVKEAFIMSEIFSKKY